MVPKGSEECDANGAPPRVCSAPIRRHDDATVRNEARDGPLPLLPDPSSQMNTRKWAMLGVPVPGWNPEPFSTCTNTARTISTSNSGGPSVDHRTPTEERREATAWYSFPPGGPHDAGSREMGKEACRDGASTDVLTVISPSSSPFLPARQKGKSEHSLQKRWKQEVPHTSYSGRNPLSEMGWEQEFSFMYDTPTLLEEEGKGKRKSGPPSLNGCPHSVKEAVAARNTCGNRPCLSVGGDASSETAAPQHSKLESSLSSSTPSTVPMATTGLEHEEESGERVGASVAALQQITELWKKSHRATPGYSATNSATSTTPSSTSASASKGFNFFQKMKFSLKKSTASKRTTDPLSSEQKKRARKEKGQEKPRPRSTFDEEQETPQSTEDGSPNGHSSGGGGVPTHGASSSGSRDLDHEKEERLGNTSVNEKKKRVRGGNKQPQPKPSSSAMGGHVKNGKGLLSSPKWTACSTLGMPTAQRTSVPSSYASIPSSALVVPQEVLQSQEEVDELWGSLQRALLDPDRIQSPPLFAGVLLRSGAEWSSSFTEQMSEKDSGMLRDEKRTLLGKGKEWLSLVYGFGVRWQNKVYRMDTKLGVSFLLRVLQELRGVEVITFNAPLLLTPLLVATGGSLHTTCISDVRVMAWMCAFFPLTVVFQYSFLKQAVLEEGMASSHPGGLLDGRGLARASSSLSSSSSEFPGNALFSLHPLTSSISSSHSVTKRRVGDGCASSSAPFFSLDPVQGFVSDIFALAPLYRHFYGHMGAKGLLQPFLRQEKRISLLLAQMKYNGIQVDLTAVSRLKTQYLEEMESAKRRAQEILSPFYPLDDFNIQSADQCRQALYEHLKLGKYLRRLPPSEPSTAERLAFPVTVPVSRGSGNLNITKGGKLSTAEETLRLLTPHHELPAVIIRYRKAAKMIQTYIEGIMQNAVVPPLVPHGRPCSSPSFPPSHPATSFEGEEVDPLCASAFPNQAAAEEARNGEPVRFSFPDGQSYALSLFSSATTTAVIPLVPPSATSRGEDGRRTTASHMAVMHPNFIHEGTETGRLSCVEPNLQNLPRGGGSTNSPPHGGDMARGKEWSLAGGAAVVEEMEEEENVRALRLCFVAPEGHVLVSIDFEQIELRVLAHMSGDNALIDALSPTPLGDLSSSSPHHTDIHTRIAEKVFQKLSISPEERNLAKRIVFGTLYGGGANSLAAQLSIPIETVRRVVHGIQHSFPSLDRYREKLIEEGRVNGYVRTLSGRIRYLPELQSAVAAQRHHAERQAFNTVVQGSAADVMKLAMLQVEQKLISLYPSHPARLLLQIHDELIFYLRSKDLLTLVPSLMEAMTSAISLRVPLPVVAKYGTSLGSLRPWTVENELGLCPSFSSL